MYKMLNGEVPIPETPQNNPVMKKKVYSEKVLAIGIKKFNEEIRKNNPLKRFDY
jgi:transcriptional regulator of NAD metabolism